MADAVEGRTRWGGVASRHDGPRPERHDHAALAPPMRLVVSVLVGIAGAGIVAWANLGAGSLWFTGAALVVATPLVPIAYLVQLAVRLFVPHERRRWRSPLTSLLYALLALGLHTVLFGGDNTLLTDISRVFLLLTMLIATVTYIALSVWQHVRRRRLLS